MRGVSSDIANVGKCRAGGAGTGCGTLADGMARGGPVGLAVRGMRRAIPKSDDAAPGRARGRRSAAHRARGDPTDGRRRVRRRQRAWHRARRRHPWLEEHRIPIDVAAGTSMGGLVGGAYATGMEPDELQTFITTLDWDQLFGASTFAYKNIRRKADARAYPSRLEFGLKGGIVPPTALNSGEYVDLLLGRIAAPYFDMQDFDDLPTPFRTVAVDLLSAQPVVMRSGSLADAMRATMSLPLIFPPTDVDGQVLIDGGTMDNVPADVVKAMGATHVIAVNVGDLSDREGRELHDAQRRGQYPRRDDARVDEARHHGCGCRHQRAARRVWIARLAAGRRTD